MGLTQYPSHESVVVSDGAGTRRAARRGLSPRLWRNIPLDVILNGGPNALDVGYGFFNDYIFWDKAPTADDALTAQFGTDGARIYMDGTGGTDILTEIDARTGGKGVLEFTCTTDNEEVWYQLGGLTSAPFLLSDTAGSCKRFGFEIRFQVSSITTNDWCWFMGLAEEGLAAADTVADNEAGIASKDLVGLYHPPADTTQADVVYRKASDTLNTHSDAFQTLAIDTWYQFGMLFDPTPTLDTSGNQVCQLKMFWNGVEQTDDVIAHSDIKASSTDDFPDGEEMSPLIGFKSGSAANSVELRIDWLCVAQMETDVY